MTDIEQALSESKRRAENVDTLKSGVHITIREDVLTEVLIEMVRSRDKVVTAARECEYCWGQVADSLGPPQKGWWKRLEAALPDLQRALAALDTPPAQE